MVFPDQFALRRSVHGRVFTELDSGQRDDLDFWESIDLSRWDEIDMAAENIMVTPLDTEIERVEIRITNPETKAFYRFSANP